MKTHEFAKSLNLMAKILRAGPNVELSEFDMLRSRQKELAAPEPDLPSALMVVSVLARFRKPDWVSVIKEYNLDIPVKKTDSVRDLLGRFINYMANSPEEVRRFTREVQTSTVAPSAELSEALSILLGENR